MVLITQDVVGWQVMPVDLVVVVQRIIGMFLVALEHLVKVLLAVQQP